MIGPTAHAPKPSVTPDPWLVAVRRSGYVALAFCVTVVVLLAVDHVRSAGKDPLLSPELTRLKAALSHHPTDEDLKRRIRELDLELRQVHADHLAFQARGAWLLLGGVAVCLASLRFANRKRKLPKPVKASVDLLERESRQSQWAVGAMALVVLAAGLWVSFQSRTYLAGTDSGAAMPPGGGGATENAVAPTDSPNPPADSAAPSAEEFARHWPRFRGPGGLGVSVHTNLALQWNIQTGEGVVWKSPVPLINPNSPVVWGTRVFVSGANAQKRTVFCFHAETGALLWQQPVDVPQTVPVEPPNVMEDSGAHAAATMATDGQRAFAIFANGDIAAFDFAGKKVWARNLGRPDIHYGHATSLELWRDRVMVQLDQGDGKDGKSKVLALDARTGQTVWESAPRPVPNSWSTPITVRVGDRDQIITTASPWVIAHDATNGVEIWRAKVLTGEVTPSAIFSQGLVFTAMESESLSAIRPDGAGDVTSTHVVWQAQDGLPDICSPLADGQRVYLMNTYGLLTCYQLADGKKLWENDFSIGFHASPSLVGDRVLLLSDDGVAIVIAAANEFKELARSEIGEPVMASPAFTDGRVFVRSKEHLFCFGAKR